MRIPAEFRTWVGNRKAADSHTPAESSVFIAELERNHPDLLAFEISENKRHLVSRWLLDAGLIKG